MKVLIVDDEPLMRASLEAAVLGAGWEPICCETAEQGLQIARNVQPDIAVLDIWLPGQDGIALLKALKAENANLRTIAMSGGGAALATETVHSLVRLWGAEHFFLKPFDETKLIEAIRSTE